MSGYDTSPSGLAAAGRKADSVLRDAKNGNPKGSSGTYSDQSEAPSRGEASIGANSINKPATPRPSGSTADTGREKP